MNFMEKLLDGVEVEWKALGSVCDLITTGKLNANAMHDDGIYPFFTCNETPYKINNYAFDLEAIIISGNGSQVGHLNYYHGKFNAYQRTYIVSGFKKHVQVMYLFHYLSHTLKAYITQNSRKGSVPYITMPMLEDFQIPIPCPGNPKKSLEIQAEIVRILDTFIELTAELTAELTVRKKQYNYYRDQLLSFEEGEVEWRTLGDLCAIGDGLHGTPEYDDKGNYFFINGNNLGNGNIVLNDKTKKVNDSMFKKHGIIFTVENTVFLSINGTIGSISFYNSEKIVLGKSVAFFNVKSSELYSRYLFYFLQTDFSKKYFETQKTGSTIKNLGLKALRLFEIPLPTYTEQARIVAILDKFDALTNSISEGLPREIALRQKQYEHYRDLLLSFPKAKIEAEEVH
jgi:type I restriction enzyme S subunit